MESWQPDEKPQKVERHPTSDWHPLSDAFKTRDPSNAHTGWPHASFLRIQAWWRTLVIPEFCRLSVRPPRLKQVKPSPVDESEAGGRPGSEHISLRRCWELGFTLTRGDTFCSVSHFASLWRALKPNFQGRVIFFSSQNKDIAHVMSVYDPIKLINYNKDPDQSTDLSPVDDKWCRKGL